MARAEGAAPDVSCIHCGTPVTSLFTRYSAASAVLTTCGSCGQAADPYVDGEAALLFIDLLLLRTPAFRHLHNVPAIKEKWARVILSLLALDTYAATFLNLAPPFPLWPGLGAGREEQVAAALQSGAGSGVEAIAPVLRATLSVRPQLLVLLVLLAVTCQWGVYLVALSAAAGRFGLRGSVAAVAVVLASAPKLCLLPSMVWAFPARVALAIECYTLCAHVVGLSVVLPPGTHRVAALALVAFAASCSVAAAACLARVGLSPFVQVPRNP